MENINNLNPVNEGQSAVVESKATDAAAQTGEVAASDASDAQSVEENSKFAQQRRKYETESAAAKQESDRLLEKAKAAGYDSLEAALDAVQAKKNDTDIQTEALEKQVIGHKMAEDLEKIQRIDPTVDNLEQLGEEFERLVAAGIDPVTAFCALKEAEKLEKPEVPSSIGAVGGNATPNGEYFSEDEINYYESHPEEVSDNVLDKLLKSLSRKKK